MRLHTDSLSEQTIREAAAKAGATLYRLNRHGSRSRNHAFDVILEGSGLRGGQWGGDYQAATWDQWGIFLADLYRRDPEMKCPAYEDLEHFHWATGDRFHYLEHADQHIRHRWDYQGDSATGSYSVHECKCGAVLRRLWRGTWQDFAA